MGEPSPYCHPAPEGCCLDHYEAVLVLVALIIVVQLALKLATVICCSVCYFLGTLFGTIFAKEPEKLVAATPKVRKPYPQKASIYWSEEEVPRRRHRESSALSRHCVHCTLEPVKFTMSLCKQAQNEHLACRERQRAGRRSYPDYLPCRLVHCCNCDCENRHRQRTSSAPSAYTVTRCRDVACGSSEPMLATTGKERRNTLPVSPEPYPRMQVGETQYHPIGPSQDTEYPGASQRSRRPTKVYIYPVHPQTPPGSRSTSPERSHRRRGTIGGGQEEPQEYETREHRDREHREREHRDREQRRKSRDVEQQADGIPIPPPPPPPPPPPLSRFRNVATNVLHGMAAHPDSPQVKQRHYWPDPTAASDWVYRPMK